MIGDVRGIGFLIGVELVADRDTKAEFPPELNLGDRLNEKFRQQGMILRTGGQTIGLNVPLCTTRNDVDEIVARLDRAFTEVEGELPS